MNNDFWFGFWVFIFPFIAVMAWAYIEEKVKGGGR